MATKFLPSIVELTVDTDAYTAGDVVGGLLSFDITGFVVQGGFINKLVLIDEDNQSEPYKLYLFRSQPSTIADDAAFAPTIADMKLLHTIITIAAGDYSTVNSLASAIKPKLTEDFHSTTNIMYGYLVCDATPDYTNADTLQITLHLVSEQ